HTRSKRDWSSDVCSSDLRLNSDGSVPADNPFPGSAVYALGLRNPWGLAFDPLGGSAYVTDNGSHGHDEVNRIVPGGNYGSPEVKIGRASCRVRRESGDGC